MSFWHEIHIFCKTKNNNNIIIIIIDHRKKSAHERNEKIKKILQMMWIGCLFCIPLQNMCWIAFAFSTTYTNSPYCKRKAISSMWFETFGFINRLLDFHNFILHSLFFVIHVSFHFISFAFRCLCPYFYMSTYMEI